jgi:hypothetical protein
MSIRQADVNNPPTFAGGGLYVLVSPRSAVTTAQTTLPFLEVQYRSSCIGLMENEVILDRWNPIMAIDMPMAHYTNFKVLGYEYSGTQLRQYQVFTGKAQTLSLAPAAGDDHTFAHFVGIPVQYFRQQNSTPYARSQPVPTTGTPPASKLLARRAAAPVPTIGVWSPVRD